MNALLLTIVVSESMEMMSFRLHLVRWFAAGVLCSALAVAAPACHTYLGNIDRTSYDRLGSGVPANDSTACCAACQATATCAAWTFWAANATGCQLYSDTGTGINQGGPTDDVLCGTCGDDDALLETKALVDVPATSGVPLGGIGVGWFDLAPDGAVSRVAINNWHENGVIWASNHGGAANATFLALWRRSGGSAHLLQRRPSVASPLLPPAAHASASPAFPTMNVTLTPPTGGQGRGANPALILTRGWSPFLPHDVANSSLPVAVLEVTVDNTQGAEADDVAVALSWQDVIGRELFDASTAQLDAFYPPPSAGLSCGFATGALMSAMGKAGIDVRTSFPRVPTFASPLSVQPPPSGSGGSGGGNAQPPLVGLQQASAAPLAPTTYTLQHYVNRVGVLAELSGPGDAVTALPAYTADPVAAAAAWAAFAANGTLPAGPAFAPGTPLFVPGGPEAASAIALRTTIPAGATRVFRFFVSWYAADTLAVQPGQDNRTFCGTGDYGKYYHGRFSSLEAVVAHAAANAPALLAGTTAWHAPFAASSLPDWLAAKIVNSAYTLYTQSILTKTGRFSMMEGGMGGLAGTMDQRIVAHALYHKLFPGLDMQELEQFAAAQNTDGSILHFDAQVYAGITGTDGVAPMAPGEYTDNTVGWLYQVAKAVIVTGDLGFASRMAPHVPAALGFLRSLRTSATFPALISGSNTYDDFWELPLDAYLCSVFPLALESGRILYTVSGNVSGAAEAAADRDAAQAQYSAALWNGRFLAYGAQLNGSGRADDILFGGATAGMFLARHAGWGDLGAPFNETLATLAAQLQLQVAPSYSFFAPKVWNTTSRARARDPHTGAPSSTWPFYLESYTALAALQAGFLDDALALLSHLHLVQARLGLTWSQNLWNPGEITYVAAPVSWFATDVLAGAALDVATVGSGGGTLWVSPVVRNATDAVAYPVFLPQAWLLVSADAAEHTLRVDVLRVFSDVNGGAPVTISTVAAAPVGRPASGAARVTLPTPFVFAEDAVLDLSAHYAVLVAPLIRAPLLPPIAP